MHFFFYFQSRQMDYKLCKCLHYEYCIFPSRNVFDLLVLLTNRWWTQADKKHLTCEDVIQWILVWTINFTFMHLIYMYNVRDINLAKIKYGIWSMLVHEISIWQYFANLNIVYIHVLYPYLDIVIVKMSNSQNIIFHICINSKYKRRKKEKYKC